MAHTDEVNQKGSGNTKSPKKSKEKRGISPAGWAAISAIGVAAVGCIGTIVAAVLNPDLAQVILDKAIGSTPTPAIISTVSIPTSSPTNTPPLSTNPTDTPEPPIIASKDWEADCISIANWKPDLENETAEIYNDCYDLVPWGIGANNGNLLFTTTSNQTISAMEYGIFTPLPQNKEFHFSIQIKTLNNSEVWIGFFDQNSLQSKGILVAIQPDDNFDIREMPSQVEFADNIHLYSEAGDYENIQIEFIGSSLYVTVDGQPILAGYPISISPKKLFLGYRMLSDGEIKATIRSMEIRKK